MPASLESRVFGSLPDGRPVEAWTLRGSGRLELEVLSYGGIVSRLLAPDRQGSLADVVLGFGGVDGYVGKHPWFGATAGRVAGRITDGVFRLDGSTHKLPVNDPPNHLHGGPNAVDKQLWSAEAVERSDKFPSLRLRYHSPDGEQGYPGAVDLAVTYTVTPSDEFVFETEVRSSRDTPVSLTNHSYFNLNGEGEGDVLDHFLRIESDAAFLADERMTLLDELRSLDGHPGDFRVSRRVGEAIPGIWQQHGDLYWLGEVKGCRPVARLHAPRSGRILHVSTSTSCLQMYAGGGLDGSLVGKSGRRYRGFGGLCMECHGYPNAIGDSAAAGFGDIVVRPGFPQRTRTVYAFSIDNSRAE